MFGFGKSYRFQELFGHDPNPKDPTEREIVQITVNQYLESFFFQTQARRESIMNETFGFDIDSMDSIDSTPSHKYISTKSEHALKYIPKVEAKIALLKEATDVANACGYLVGDLGALLRGLATEIRELYQIVVHAELYQYAVEEYAKETLSKRYEKVDSPEVSRLDLYSKYKQEARKATLLFEVKERQARAHGFKTYTKEVYLQLARKLRALAWVEDDSAKKLPY